MRALMDTPERYGAVSRLLHWGMALLLLAQFVAAAAHWGLPRDDAFREAVWSYHPDLGITLFIIVLLRGVWGLSNLSRRPDHPGAMGKIAVLVHLLMYGPMIAVPGARILGAAGSERGLSFLGMEIFAPQQVEVAWMQAPAEWHGEMGWVLLALIVGHAFMGLVWHGLVRRDGTLERMTG